MWPFGKKNKDVNKDDQDNLANAANGESGAASHTPADNNVADAGAEYASQGDTPADAAAASGEAPAADESTAGFVTYEHDAVNGETGPFDGDVVDVMDFDFGDFSSGLLDLGSMKIALPKESQVQVEMGDKGPKMLHIVTRYGRITPVAFAAPRSAGQWAEAGQDLVKGIQADGLPTCLEQGPWGTEIVGTNDNGTIRIIGVECRRWMLRFTLAAPTGMEDDLAQLGREIIARTFVYRGDEPILAGNSLPVTMPQQLADQVRKAMEQRKQQEREAAAASANHPENAPGTPDPQAHDEAASQLRDLDAPSADNPEDGGQAGTGSDQPKN